MARFSRFRLAPDVGITATAPTSLVAAACNGAPVDKSTFTTARSSAAGSTGSSGSARTRIVGTSRVDFTGDVAARFLVGLGHRVRGVETSASLFTTCAYVARRSATEDIGGTDDDDAFTTACVASPSGATSATTDATLDAERPPLSGARGVVVIERAHYPPTQRGYVRTNTRLVLLYASLYGDDDDDDASRRRRRR